MRIALYGKLPAHGDFVRRGLSPRASKQLHDWLQSGLAALPAADRDRRIEAAPPWRFAAPAGLLADEPMAGMMAPSCDSVGRVYPLVAALPCASVAAALMDGAWDAVLDRRVAQAGQGGLTADQLVAALEQDLAREVSRPERSAGPAPLKGGLRITVGADAALRLTLLQTLQAAGGPGDSQSLWWRRTEDGAVLVRADGMPVDEAFESLFGGAQSIAPCSTNDPHLSDT